MELLQSWTAEAPTPERWHAFYVRVTREESVQADLSIPNQIARANEVAAARGWRDYKIYAEPRHVSAELWTDKRPALRALLEDIRVGRILGICSRHTDRLWRGNTIQGRILDALRPARVELWDFAHQFDYRSAHGRFSLQVLGAASELEVNLTAERIREMKRGKAMKGRTGGGPPPYGYTSQSRRMAEYKAAGHEKDEAYALACRDIAVGKCWVIDEKEAEVVRLIFELYSSSKYRFGCKRIAQHLNAHGYKTRNGHAWLANYVIRLVNNPVYAGFTTYDEASYENRAPSKAPRHKQKLFKGEHPPLIDANVWERAQAIKRDENTVKRVKGGPSAAVFSLTGILRCPSCGSRMIGKWSHHSTRLYYICDRRHNGGKDLCSFPLLDATALHREAWNWVHQILTSPSFVMEHVQHLEQRLRQVEPESARRIAAVEKRRDEIKAALAKYFARFEASSDADQDDVLLDRVRELKAELKGVEAELVELRKQVVPLPPRVSEEQVRRYLEKLRDRVDTRPEYQRVLFHQLKRSHDFVVKVVSKTEFVLSLALPANDLVADEPQTEGARDRRLMTVVTGSGGVQRVRGGSAETERAAAAGTRVFGGSEVTGSPPPTSPAALTVWCGARKGRAASTPRSALSRPATEWTAVTSSASSRDIGGMIVGRRRASIVLPKPMTSDPPLYLERPIVVPLETIDISAWVAEQTGKHLCACGCGQAVRIFPRHHWRGIPAHVHGHHVGLMRKEVADVRAAGQMTAPEVARALGIGRNSLTALERRIRLGVPRTGKHALRSYAPEHLAALRAALGPRGTGAGVGLFYMDEVAKRAGCKPHTIAHRRGVDLPVGRWVTHPHRGWVFTEEEVAAAVAQIKRWPRLSRRRRGLSASPSSMGRR